jgi:cyclophilin family peptidyl-prolyl cis-trans isomerase
VNFSTRDNAEVLVVINQDALSSHTPQLTLYCCAVLAQAQWLDGKYVAFGMVLEGYHLIQEIEEYGQLGGTPTARIVISNCGVMPVLPEDKTPHYVSEWD